MTNPEPAPQRLPNPPSNPGNPPDVPPSGSEGSVGNAWRGVRGMNRWVLLGIVAVILLIVWYYYDHRQKTVKANPDGSSPSEGENTSNDWESKARSLLKERGYPQAQIDSAMTHYLHGGQMSTQDTALIAVCIRALGTPDIPNPAPSVSSTDNQNPWTNPGPAAPSGTAANSSSNELVNSDTPLFIYVVSTGFGWTSSLRGISAQLYGSSNYAATLLQYNPTITSVSNRIPVGTRIKAPRTVSV